MSATFRIVGLVFALAVLPLAGSAQEAAGDGAEPSTDGGETSGANTAAGTDLALGATEQNNGVGSTYIKESHGDWEMRCIRTESGNDPCQLYQLLVDGKGNSVAEINLFVVAENPQIVAGATVVTPLETLLTADLRLRVDAGEVKVYPFAFCRTIGCFSRIGLTGDEVVGFQRGAKAVVLIVPAAAPDQTVELSASLTGFTAGWNALRALEKAPAE